MPNHSQSCPIRWDFKVVSAFVAIVGLLLTLGLYLVNISMSYADDRALAAKERSALAARVCVLENIADQTRHLPQAVARQTAILERIERRMQRFESVLDERGER